MIDDLSIEMDGLSIEIETADVNVYEQLHLLISFFSVCFYMEYMCIACIFQLQCYATSCKFFYHTQFTGNIWIVHHFNL